MMFLLHSPEGARRQVAQPVLLSRIGLKSQIFPHISHLAPSLGVTAFEFMEKLYGSWN